jgi:hypothetical protein
MELHLLQNVGDQLGLAIQARTPVQRSKDSVVRGKILLRGLSRSIPVYVEDDVLEKSRGRRLSLHIQPRAHLKDPKLGSHATNPRPVGVRPPEASISTLEIEVSIMALIWAVEKVS